MLWKYDLKEASWYLDNPVKETIWTAIVKKTRPIQNVYYVQKRKIT